MTIQTTDKDGNQTHTITVNPARNEFFKIQLPDGRELTLDTSYGQVYYRVRAGEFKLTTDQVEAGIMVCNVDIDDATGDTVGIELIP